jgi:hypothetical protein
MSIYVPKHFQLYELVPQEEYWKYIKKGDMFWWMFDRDLLVILDNLRNMFGKMVINDWYWGGENQYRGWRPMDIFLGSALSQHKFGRAVDVTTLETSVNTIREYIRNNQKRFPTLSAVEDDVSWLHIDTRNWDRTKNGILFFKP